MNHLETGKASGATPVHVLLVEDSQMDVLLLKALLAKDRDTFVIHTAGSMAAAISHDDR